MCSEAAALRRAAKDRRPGRATGVTRLRARLCLHVWAGREILIGKVVVVASVHVPIAHDMATSGHFLPWGTSRPNIDCSPAGWPEQFLWPVPGRRTRGRRI